MDGDTRIPHRGRTGAAGAGGVPPEANPDLTKLTSGERLWLWRTSRQGRRPKTGIGNESGRMTQLEAGVILGVDSSQYWSLEHSDQLPDNVADAVFKELGEPPLTRAAQCRLARRRSPLTLTAVVVELGLVSRPTLYKLEAAADPRLVAFWEGRGFRFS
jgi:hypothetical protein